MARKRADQRPTDIDHALRGMFRAIEARALPEQIRCVVDQLMTPPAEPPAREAA